MGDVHDRHARRDSEDDSLHRAGEMVGGAEVCRESYDGWTCFAGCHC
jgi:hypothetical protein